MIVQRLQKGAGSAVCRADTAHLLVFRCFNAVSVQVAYRKPASPSPHDQPRTPKNFFLSKASQNQYYDSLFDL